MERDAIPPAQRADRYAPRVGTTPTLKARTYASGPAIWNESKRRAAGVRSWNGHAFEEIPRGAVMSRSMLVVRSPREGCRENGRDHNGMPHYPHLLD